MVSPSPRQSATLPSLRSKRQYVNLLLVHQDFLTEPVVYPIQPSLRIHETVLSQCRIVHSGEVEGVL